MAVTRDQITTINDALKALGIQPGDDTRLSPEEVARGLETLVAMVNGSVSDGQTLEYDRTEGYTEALGQALSEKIAALKNDADFQKAESNYNFLTKDIISDELSSYSDMPDAIIKDPQKLFDLVAGAPDIIAALDAADKAEVLDMAAPVDDVEESPEESPAAVAEDVTQDSEGDAPEEAADAGEAEPEKPAEETPEEIAEKIKIATKVVETMLGGDPDSNARGLPALLNETLEKETAALSEAERALAPLKVGNLLDRRALEIEKSANGILGSREQASLQGILNILGHEEFIGGFNSRIYTPDIGREIKDGFPALMEKLKGKMSAEEYAAIKENLNDDDVAVLIAALDYLHEHKQINTELLVDNTGQPINDIPAYTASIFQDRIDEFQTDNPDMVRLLNALTYEYTAKSDAKTGDVTGGFDVAELMLLDVDDFDILELGIPIDKASRQAELQKYFDGARANGASREDIALLINTVITLPFGNEAYRRGWQRDAIAALSSENFAGDVVNVTEKLRGQHGNPEYVYANDRETLVLDPKLENFSIMSDGEKITADDIFGTYNDFHRFHAPQELREKGQIVSLYEQTFITFKDDEGDIYVAAADKSSGILRIEKMDVGAVQAGMKQHDERYAAAEKEKGELTTADKVDAHRAMLEAVAEIDNPGIAALTKPNGGLMASPDYIVNTLAKNAGFIQEQFARERAWAQEQKEQLVVQEVREAGEDSTPYLSGAREQVVTHTPRAKEAEPLRNVHQRAVEITRELNPLLRYAAKRVETPTILRPEEINGHQGVLDMLQKFEGEELKLGTNLGDRFRVTGVDVQTGDEPLMSWYDHKTATVRVAPISSIIPEGDIQALRRDLEGIDTKEGYERIQDQHPEFFEIVQNYRRGATPDHAPYWNFNPSARTVLYNL